MIDWLVFYAAFNIFPVISRWFLGRLHTTGPIILTPASQCYSYPATLSANYYYQPLIMKLSLNLTSTFITSKFFFCHNVFKSRLFHI